MGLAEPFKLCEQKHKDCFANKSGYCISLNNTDFPYKCPFYKREEDFQNGRKEETNKKSTE